MKVPLRESARNVERRSVLEMGVCQGCGIPLAFAQLNRWHTDGDITQAGNEQARMAFVECENVDPLFRELGRLLGHSIDHLVINIVARGTQLYMDTLTPQEVKEMIRNKTIDMAAFSQGVIDICHAIGYGKYEFLGYRYENDPEDYCKIRITKPFSILETSGAFAGVVASSVGGEHSVTFEEVAPEVYELTTGWTTYPEVVKEKLRLQLYRRKEGDVELERCQECGTPSRLSSMCTWDLENGIIRNRANGCRMSVLGPGLMDTVFDALEWELGEEIPQMVVEAQSGIVRQGFPAFPLELPFEEVRTEIALRGLGNLRELRLEEGKARLRIDNSCMRLLVVGWLKGSFEMLRGGECEASWQVSPAGSLEVELTLV